MTALYLNHTPNIAKRISGVQREYPGFRGNIRGSEGISGVQREYPGFRGNIRVKRGYPGLHGNIRG